MDKKLKFRHSAFVAIFFLLILTLLTTVTSYFPYLRAFPIKKASAATTIQHIVYLVKENHTFDNYFGAFPGVNGATTGKVKVNGVVQTIPLGPFQDKPPYDYPHGWSGAQKAYDNGAMDIFNQGNCSTAPYPCYQVAQQSDLPNYWAYAQTYLLNDNAFSNLRGPSFPNHMYTVAGASGPDSSHSAITNPSSTANGYWGCDAPTGTTVQLANGTTQYPCFTGVTTLADEMTQAGISWKYYAPQPGQGGYVWNSLDAFEQGGGNLYRAAINGKNLIIQKSVNGTVTQLKSVSFAATPNISYTLRFNATGTTLSAKVWQTGTTEPSNWMATVTDTSLTSGYSGLREVLQSGTTVTITSFQATQQ